MTDKPRTVGLILAGGRGLRSGGADKGLLPWGPATLVDAVLARLQAQVDVLAISANRNTAVYAQRQVAVLAVLADADPQAFDGPLAGVLAGMAFAHAQGCTWLQLAPCDNPSLPLDLRARLGAAAAPDQAAYPQTPEGPEPAHALLPVAAWGQLQTAWASGERSLRGALRSLHAVAVPWGPTADFRNLNHRATGQS